MTFLGMPRSFYYSLILLVTCSMSRMSRAEISDDFSLSGFGRIVVGMLDTEQASFKGYDHELSAKPDSLLGLQLNYQISDSLQASAQAVFRSSDTEDSDLEWLYLTWTPSDNLTFRLGRQRGPFFLYSDSIDIGYSYHWINLPYQIYSGYIFPTFDGLDVIWGYSTNDLDFTFEGYAGKYGGGDINIFGGTTDYELKAVAGLIAKVRYQNTELRLSRYRGHPKLNVPELTEFSSALEAAGYSKSAEALKAEGWGSISQIGLTYDNLGAFVRAEWMKSESDIQYMVPVVESYYLSAGLYAGDFTYHLTYSRGMTHYTEFEQEIPLGVDPGLDQLYYGLEEIFSILTLDNLDTWTLGARWDLKEHLALKAEISWLDGKAGQNSFYDAPEEGFNRNATLVLFGVDWVF